MKIELTQAFDVDRKCTRYHVWKNGEIIATAYDRQIAEKAYSIAIDCAKSVIQTGDETNFKVLQTAIV